MVTVFFILMGFGLVGVSLYMFFGDKLFKNEPENMGISSLLQESTDEYSYSIPQPTSLKSMYIGGAVGLFGISFLFIFYLVNYSESFAGKFWVFIFAIVFFSFGCTLFSLSSRADKEMVEKETYVTSINRERLEQRKQEVDFAFLKAEKEKEAQLRQIKLDQEHKNHEILAGLYGQAKELGIPLENLAGLNEEKLRAALKVEANRQIEEHTTQQAFIRDINTKKVESYGDRETIANINRTQYNKLSSELIREIGELEERIVVLKADKEITKPVKKVRIDNIQRDIKNKEFQLDALQAGLVSTDYGQEEKRLNS